MDKSFVKLGDGGSLEGPQKAEAIEQSALKMDVWVIEDSRLNVTSGNFGAGL